MEFKTKNEQIEALFQINITASPDFTYTYKGQQTIPTQININEGITAVEVRKIYDKYLNQRECGLFDWVEVTAFDDNKASVSFYTTTFSEVHVTLVEKLINDLHRILGADSIGLDGFTKQDRTDLERKSWWNGRDWFYEDLECENYWIGLSYDPRKNKMELTIQGVKLS